MLQNEVEASGSDMEFEALFLDESWDSLEADNVTGYAVFRVSQSTILWIRLQSPLNGIC